MWRGITSVVVGAGRRYISTVGMLVIKRWYRSGPRCLLRNLRDGETGYGRQ